MKSKNGEVGRTSTDSILLYVLIYCAEEVVRTNSYKQLPAYLPIYEKGSSRLNKVKVHTIRMYVHTYVHK